MFAIGDRLASPSRTTALLALTASIIVAQEVLLTRLLSVTTWYSLAFVVINLAMLGLTAGALQAMRAERAGKPFESWLARRMVILGAGLLVADFLTVRTPLSFSPEPSAFVLSLIVLVANAIPLIVGGSVIARIMARGGASIPTLYAVDLLAAAGGALLPLAILGPLSAPSAMALLAGLAAAGSFLAAPKLERTSAITVMTLAAVVIVLTEASHAGLIIEQAKGTTFRSRSDRPLLEEWNVLSYVYATPMKRQEAPVLWAPSPVFRPSGVYPTSFVKIDADAWTPIHAYRDPAELTFLRYDGITAAHALRPRGTACVIGVGGGRDVLSALHYGHPRVFGIEINPALIDVLHRAADVSPVIRDPRVEVVLGDGRAVLARTNIQ